MNAKQRRQVRRARERIEAAWMGLENTKWARGYEPQARVTWHRSSSPDLPGRALIWPSPRRCLTRWHDGSYALTLESGVTFPGLTEAQARRYLDGVPWPSDEDAAWCWGN